METMSPSSITAGQIGKFQELLGAGLRKSGLLSDPSQQVLETQGEPLVAELVAAIRKRVEAVSNMIVRRVRVDRSRTHKQALDATGRTQYVNEEVLATAPKGIGEEVDVFFFDLDYDPTVDQLDHELELRGLGSDVDALIAANAADPAFADDRPNATQWRDANGKACSAVFYRFDGERHVYVYRSGIEWYRDDRFSGVRK